MKNSETEKKISSETTKINLSKNGITRPSIELDDFFAYLDPKVVKKIKETSEQDRQRITNDIQQYEYELNGAKNILDSLD